MTTTQKLTFEEYLTLADTGFECRTELIDGELIELPPESGINTEIAATLFAALLAAGVDRLHLKMGNCELQTPVLSPGDAANRYPDIVVIREEHRSLTRDRMTITLDMPPPRFVLEVVSPGKTNRDRDYTRKRAQYAAVGIPEYVIVDPLDQRVVVLILENVTYRESGRYRNAEVVQFTAFPTLQLTAQQILSAGHP
ncbi:Uma2 family endonuclease [Phormidesmis sp. 146-35]